MVFLLSWNPAHRKPEKCIAQPHEDGREEQRQAPFPLSAPLFPLLPISEETQTKMRSLKALVLARRSLPAFRSLSNPVHCPPNPAPPKMTLSTTKSVRRCAASFRFVPAVLLFSSCSSVSVLANGDPFQVLVEGKASARAAILNMPSALNALTTNMVLVSWIPSVLGSAMGCFSFFCPLACSCGVRVFDAMNAELDFA